MIPTTTDYAELSTDYERIEQAILYLERNFRSQPALKDVAESIGLSEYHFQRLFTRWVGISPKRFLQYLTKEYALRLLEQSEDVLETAYQSGLSGPGRLHDLLVNCEAVTPGEYKQQGAGLTIQYGFHPTPFGECLLAVTGRGICALAFVEDGERARAPGRARETVGQGPPGRGPAGHRSAGGAHLCPSNRAGPAAAQPLSQGHQFPDQGVGGPPAHPGRLCGILRKCCRRHWHAQRSPRRQQRGSA